jgi:hypothetical protein
VDAATTIKIVASRGKRMPMVHNSSSEIYHQFLRDRYENGRRTAIILNRCGIAAVVITGGGVVAAFVYWCRLLFG